MGSLPLRTLLLFTIQSHSTYLQFRSYDRLPPLFLNNSHMAMGIHTSHKFQQDQVVLVVRLAHMEGL
jgi:hypothetical protein